MRIPPEPRSRDIAKSLRNLDLAHENRRRHRASRVARYGRLAVSATEADTGIGQKLTAPFLELLPITGVALAVLDREKKASVIHISDATAGRLEEAHFDLGAGPLFECFTTMRPVLIPSVSDEDRWPFFLSQASELNVNAIFVFPLILGAACVGTVLCYRTTAGPLDDDSVEVGAALARAVSAPALRQAISLAGDEKSREGTPIEMRREVHQATGMMLAQLDIDATEALARMRAYAFSQGLSLRDVARDVVNRRLNFSSVED
ncbi:hypothetical protein L1277_002614 [Okibacterium sp. HSC-33S16]|uniref:GAF and ANTAR domain-containing protein n=1 Tax=Okibacterium sp. HSC-33S16 TaxID=2910965 RepID=UPI00209FCC2B|nr:GAF and ANTAR domain-containing protein [Okibacterium sp. HSC-33S16]MCP2032511.1 hypothetical protein [Okibacterium sp. HSC-33S16]